MFSTSHDILNLILSISILALVFFLSWAIYYFVIATHKIFKIVKKVEKGVDKAENIIDSIHEKVKNSGPYVMIISEIAKQTMNFIKDQKKSPKTRKKTKK